MKDKLIYFILGMIIIVILGLYASNHCGLKEMAAENTEEQILPTEALFVPIHVDTLNFYLKKHYASQGLKTKKQSSLFEIVYNSNAMILLHANNNKMPQARKMLETVQKKDFSVRYLKGITMITMNKNGDYVDCPALIVAEILRKQNNQ